MIYTSESKKCKIDFDAVSQRLVVMDEHGIKVLDTYEKCIVVLISKDGIKITGFNLLSNGFYKYTELWFMYHE